MLKRQLLVMLAVVLERMITWVWIRILSMYVKIFQTDPPMQISNRSSALDREKLQKVSPEVMNGCTLPIL